ncbi:MAG: DRTGG domain-containing protein [Anaerolineales bacterium]
MKILYVASVEPFSGKTSLCLALGRRAQTAGRRVGYLKPLSTQPWRTPAGAIADEDAAFVAEALGLAGAPETLSPVVVTQPILKERLARPTAPDLLDRVQAAIGKAGRGVDVLLLEGGASLREGHVVGLSISKLADVVDTQAMALVRFRSPMQALDDSLAAHFRLGARLLGVVFNHVPEEAATFLREEGVPFLQGQGIRTLGALPHRPMLSALSVGEVATLLASSNLTRLERPEALIEAFTVGAMTADMALARFRRQPNKAVITGGDRTDIQLAALETSTVALILTGNLTPNPAVLEQAEAQSVPVLLVKESTIETVELIERAYGKTRLGSAQKLEDFLQLAAKHLDFASIDTALGLTS